LLCSLKGCFFFFFFFLLSFCSRIFCDATSSYLITICTSVSVVYLFTNSSMFITIWYLQMSAILIGKATFYFFVTCLLELLDQSEWLWSSANLIFDTSYYSFDDPGPHGSGRYSERMLPEIEKKDFRKGSQVFIY